MGLKGKIFKFMSGILKDGSYYRLYTQAKSTSACGLPKGFFNSESESLNIPLVKSFPFLPSLVLLYVLPPTVILYFT